MKESNFPPKAGPERCLFILVCMLTVLMAQNHWSLQIFCHSQLNSSKPGLMGCGKDAIQTYRGSILTLMMTGTLPEQALLIIWYNVIFQNLKKKKLCISSYLRFMNQYYKYWIIFMLDYLNKYYYIIFKISSDT